MEKNDGTNERRFWLSCRDRNAPDHAVRSTHCWVIIRHAQIPYWFRRINSGRVFNKLKQKIEDAFFNLLRIIKSIFQGIKSFTFFSQPHAIQNKVSFDKFDRMKKFRQIVKWRPRPAVLPPVD